MYKWEPPAEGVRVVATPPRRPAGTKSVANSHQIASAFTKQFRPSPIRRFAARDRFPPPVNPARTGEKVANFPSPISQPRVSCRGGVSDFLGKISDRKSGCDRLQVPDRWHRLRYVHVYSCWNSRVNALWNIDSECGPAGIIGVKQRPKIEIYMFSKIVIEARSCCKQ